MRNRLIFLGTGTSQGVPVIACDCPVCSSNDPRDKRLRVSVYIEYEGVHWVIDTGPDFRQQMLRAQVQRVDAVLFTHEHKDHTAGLDDIRAFNFKWNMDMPVFAESRVQKSLKREFSYIFSDDPYPGIPQVQLFDVIEGESVRHKKQEIIPIRGYHFKLPVFGYRIGNLAYITDINRMEEEEMKKLEGLDVLIINALRKEKHISHFNLEEALSFIAALAPKKAFLTHISHLFGKHEEEQKELPSNVFIAYDELEIQF